VSRVAVLAVVLSVLPPACAKLMGDGPPPAAPDVAPPPVPVTSATTPPAWHPPEPTTSPSAATSAGPPPGNAPDLVKARAAADAKDFKKVRSLLEKKVRGGKCAPEESLLVLRACTALKDKACVADVRAKHGEDLTE